MLRRKAANGVWQELKGWEHLHGHGPLVLRKEPEIKMEQVTQIWMSPNGNRTVVTVLPFDDFDREYRLTLIDHTATPEKVLYEYAGPLETPGEVSGMDWNPPPLPGLFFQEGRLEVRPYLTVGGKLMEGPMSRFRYTKGFLGWIIATFLPEESAPPA